ncbi:peptidase S24 S26A S26B S26C family [Micractinium conductrix]|uniref:Peptidase S24 S26A S26B S26C family n=1 Tax=Micractinium conductrix TaxID=554055 RepID=A0A2P6V0N0_9CHLO|nr:peptidase S24 S26A S26B S26C family [Micractinium conductrix]|eukprot:PSC67635.1 peptidase S24 S26A S26B S26C family [Micractinium conductrix]
MAHRVSARYFGLKLGEALQAAAAAAQSSATASLSEALQRGMAAYRARLTMPMLIGGAAMAPTLNPKGASQPDAVEHLLVRLLPRPSERSVFAGDVVAFTSPLTLAVAAGPAGVAGLPLGGGGAAAAAAADQEELAERLRHSAMVRRVAAMPGDELVTGEEEDSESFVVPEGHCWVLADNEAMQPPHVIDSRSFGPLPLVNIVGRILYAARSESDHGPVENSEEGMAADAPVVEAELDIGALCGGGGGGGGPGEE